MWLFCLESSLDMYISTKKSNTENYIVYNTCVYISIIILVKYSKVIIVVFK